MQSRNDIESASESSKLEVETKSSRSQRHLEDEAIANRAMAVKETDLRHSSSKTRGKLKAKSNTEKRSRASS